MGERGPRLAASGVAGCFYEGAEAFLGGIAVGGVQRMPGCARVVREAMASVGSPYDRDRTKRHSLLAALAADDVDARDPFEAVNARFYALLRAEAGGFAAAADTYAEGA